MDRTHPEHTRCAVGRLAVFCTCGARSVLNRSLNMFSLIGERGGRGVSSAVAAWAPDLFPAGFRDAQGHVGVYFEVASVIAVLLCWAR